jgi:hypothetical protein
MLRYKKRSRTENSHSLHISQNVLEILIIILFHSHSHTCLESTCNNGAKIRPGTLLWATISHWPALSPISFPHFPIPVPSFSNVAYSFTLKMDAPNSSKTLITFYQTTQHQWSSYTLPWEPQISHSSLTYHIPSHKAAPSADHHVCLKGEGHLDDVCVYAAVPQLQLGMCRMLRWAHASCFQWARNRSAIYNKWEMNYIYMHYLDY